MPEKTVLITGCSERGVGAALAKAFRAKGYHVTLRNMAKAGSLAGMDGVDLLELEVTSTESIQQCAKAVEKRTGGSLDVLVNNAGVTECSPLLDVPLDQTKMLYDVNVWSIVAMAQAFAPMLIKAQGVIVKISSVVTKLTSAWSGIYNSSKAAETVLSETLRLELEPLGVRVITVMLRAVETGIFDDVDDLELPEMSYYHKARDFIDRQRKGLIYTTKQDVTATNIVRDIVSGRTSYICLGAQSSLCWWLLKLLPEKVLISMLNSDNGLAEIRRGK
ncbi:hypothetical protein V1525DRAFT_391555 [Lipomyces kononenkoae]|uniref:Uncharacterized protein n=1 Tax=Lipomyces kononenkoae TaxID=34357 RepID=A0ACC3SRV8_LIPKO